MNYETHDKFYNIKLYLAVQYITKFQKKQIFQKKSKKMCLYFRFRSRLHERVFYVKSNTIALIL